jgi:hypothetical protein
MTGRNARKRLEQPMDTIAKHGGLTESLAAIMSTTANAGGGR